MRSSRRNEIAAGAFVLAMGVALLVWLSLLGSGTGATDRYTIVYRNVLGIEPGVDVLFEGYRVGFVDEITPIDRGGHRAFRLEVAVERGWPIPEGSVATISAPGLLAAIVIDIRGGDSGELIEPGSEIPGREAADVFSAVSSVAEETLDLLQGSIRPLLEELAADGPVVIDDVGAILGSLQEAAAQLNAILHPDNVGRMTRILSNVESASERTAALIADFESTKAELDQLLVDTGALLDPATGQIGAAADDLEHSLDAVARHVDAITSNLEATTRNLKELTEDVRGDPGLLIRGREDGEQAP